MFRPCVLAAAIAALAGCVAPPERTAAAQEARTCFRASEVTSFSDAGSDRVLVRIGRRETWELTLSPGCPDINWAMRIGIRSRGGERICTGANAELLVPNASETGMQRCLVRDVRKLASDPAAEPRGGS